MTEQGDLPRVNFPQPKYSVSHYAGSYTPVLEKKYFAWVDESKPHDTFCVICLKNLKASRNVLHCKTCSRAFHDECLSPNTCPLCMKRLWDEEPPFKRTSSILGVNDDDQVKLWRRHAKWNERVKDKAFSRWVTFYDDGSLTSDRFLIKLMLVSLPNKFKAFKALKEQAEDCEVRVQYENSVVIRKAETELAARKQGLSTLQNKWNNFTMNPYIEAMEDAIAVLEVAINERRLGNRITGSEDGPKTQTKQLREASEKLRASESRVRDLEMSKTASTEQINSLTATIKRLQEALAKANAQAGNNAQDVASRATATTRMEATSEVQIDDDKIIRLLSLCLESSAKNHPAVPNLLAGAGFEKTHVERLMKREVCGLSNEKSKRPQEQEREREPPPTAKRRTRSEAAREDTKVLKREE